MSRTYKDRPYKLRSKENQWEWSLDLDKENNWTKLPTTRTKKRKEVNTENNWMTTPMWWIREFNTVPQRRAGRDWQRNAERTPIEALEECDTPNVSRKPHYYYW